MHERKKSTYTPFRNKSTTILKIVPSFKIKELTAGMFSAAKNISRKCLS